MGSQFFGHTHGAIAFIYQNHQFFRQYRTYTRHW